MIKFLSFLLFLVLHNALNLNLNLILIFLALYAEYVHDYIHDTRESNYILHIIKIRFNKKVNFSKFLVFLKSLFRLLSNLTFLTKKKTFWKPIFKKSSYFGLYRSNKNQWLNK